MNVYLDVFFAVNIRCVMLFFLLISTYLYFQSVEGLILLPDTLSEVSGPVKRALRARRKAGLGQSGLLFVTAGDKGDIRVWSSDDSGPPCLTSCGQLDKDSAASSSSKPEQIPSEGGRREGEGEERERDLAHVYTSLHLCEELGALCGVTHDHNLVLYDLPQLSLRKQVSRAAVDIQSNMCVCENFAKDLGICC